ncbi:type I polyketide synthase [Actinokineospora bangkokensis]|uniref:6-deoxyerythronolide-B synthase n=1 Tax=Actinokineospora bangkokensis TaxID=1193682 RepID=A0A1Q9LNZ2_9PSEU|nr:type I polyketide synthase [Actinokineospora bangkokensis]OLR93777.1 hypothetical protein BJP25_16165 [Actinokineospora bangkokensis]
MPTSQENKLRDYLKRVTAELAETRDRLDEARGRESEPIAVVGMACRYPGGVSSPDGLWELVTAGVDAIGELPGGRGWDLGALAGHQGGFLRGADEFDPGFFGISPREALAMDPQQRVLLEVAWEAVEHARIDVTGLRGSRAGVFVGAGPSGYGSDAAAVPDGAEGHLLTGGSGAVLSGRIAYTLGFTGPAVTVDTACSSSLVAVHLAVQALRRGECATALAGGVTVMALPTAFQEFAKQGGLAADGRCRAFGAGADGTGWGEGVGVLVLERLSQARAAGHRVLAVIRGSAVNSDGASNGLTAPSGAAQRRVIHQALAAAGLSGDQVDAVEAHGTGTTLGDPIEAHALLATYGRGRSGDPLWLGSVKSNIGHTQAAAGVAGMIKMIQALRVGVLPRTLHADQPSPDVDWASGRVELLTDNRPWPSTGNPRRAAVSAFGVGGTNAHVVLESAPETEAPEDTGTVPASGPVSWLLSGRTAASLPRQAAGLLAGIGSDADPLAVAAALATTRAALPHRTAVVGETAADLLDGLRAIAGGDPSPLVVPPAVATTGKLAFLFSGQGAQRAGMGSGLYATEPVFAAALDELCGHLDELTGQDVRAAMFAGDAGDAENTADAEEGATLLDRTDLTQVVLFAFEVAAYRLLVSKGLRPDHLLGHSIGELAAAHVAGVFDVADACRLVAARGALMRTTGPGAMVSIAAAEDAVRELLDSDEVGIAAVNGPAATVVSGAVDAVAEVARRAAELGYRTKRLRVEHAFHSAHMDAVLEEFRRVAESITYHPAQLPIVSGLTGETATDAQLRSADYWVTHIRDTVRFGAGVRHLADAGVRRFVELGPSAALANLVDAAVDDAVVVPVSRVDSAEPVGLAAALARLHVVGTRVDWAAHYAGVAPADVPVHSFSRERFWLPSAPARPDAGLWDALNGLDAAELGRVLGADDDQRRSLDTALPLLTRWLDTRREQAAVAEWTYRLTWEHLPTPGGSPTGTWAVVGHDDEATAHVEAALRGAGAHPVRATADDLAALDDLHGVVSLLALDETAHPGTPSLPAGLAANTALAQAVTQLDAPVPLWLLTRGAVGTSRSDAPTADSQATTWGLGHVIALEAPDRWGGLIDLPAEWDERTGRTLAACLASATDSRLALRPTGVFGQRITRFRPTAPSTGWTRGTTLITGGSGALAASTARWLADHGAEHLLLASRRGPDAPGAAALAAELEAKGVQVTTAACDTADRDQLAALLRAVPAEKPLTAVVHTAGVLDDGVLGALSPERLAAVLRPKVDTARHLDELTREHPVTAFVLFSSLAATAGSAGQANYAAANAALDALAQRRAAEGLPATSVAWGPWAGAGMAADDTVAERLRRAGTPAMEPTAACTALHAAVACGEPVAVVADIDWARFVPASAPAKARAFFTPLGSELPAAEQATPGTDWAGLRGADRVAALTTLVRAHAAAVLGHDGPDRVEASLSFRENGFDSLTAVEFRNRLTAATGLRLTPTLVFDFPTPAELVAHLDGLLGGRETPAEAAPAVAVVADDPIAIVGIGCRFPGGADTPEAFWRLIADGVDALGPFPADRGWPTTGGDHARVGGFLADAASFDAAFFGISPREALAMDPQQRLLLHTSWEALERAGLDPAGLRGGRVGVFIGTNGQDYPALLARAEDDLGGHAATGNAASVVSGRIAYALGLHGPAITVDTACSASLVALHLAAESLRRGECDLALAGGATVMSTPAAFVEFARQGGLAADGRCKPFGAGADGTGWGEGAGVLAVERLSDARRLGHPVLAVVRGSAINSDGASNGLTAPNGPAQQRVIADALRRAGLTPADVDVVEAHGTGTALGDPIEAQALLAAYGQDRAEPLWIGSVKSNIGHTQAAAGVAGVIKLVLAMSAGVAPRSLHADEVSPHVDWAAGAVRVLADSRPWPAGDRPRRGAVSAFGVSGTNAHVIIEGVDPDPTPAAVDRPAVWVLSGRTDDALRAQAGRLLDAVDGSSTQDIAFSLATTRTAFPSRGAVAGSNREELLAGLRAVRDGGPGPLVGTASPVGRLAVVFPGQGAQRVDMGKQLHAAFPVFAEAFDEVAAHVDTRLRRPLREVIAGPDLHDTEFTQPALFAVEVALHRLLLSWGLRPDVLAGHSIGEIAAAHVAGVLDLPSAAELVVARGRLMQDLPTGGAMVSVTAPESEVLALLDGTGVDIAAVNGPNAVVLSGPDDAVARVADALAARGHRTKQLRVSHAFHSALMEPALDRFRAVLDGLTFAAPTIPVISAVTGREAAFDADYWITHARHAVRFADALTTLQEHGATHVVEAGPGGALSAMAAEVVPGAVAVPLLRGTDDEPALVRTALAKLHVSGVALDWRAVFAADNPRRVALPTYAFQGERFWPRLRPSAEDHGLGYGVHWQRITGEASAGGRWLVLDPDLAEAMAARGVEVVDDGQDATGVLYAPGRAADVPRTLGELAQAGVSAPLWCVTRSAVALGGEDVDPEQAAVWGLGRVAALEVGVRWGGLIDLPADTDDIDQLIAALAGTEDQVVVRGAARYGRRITRAAASGATWTPRGTALVTGGTGGIGAEVARWLARGGAEHVVLASRSGRDAPGAEALVTELGDLGARVTVVACDLADRAAVDALVAEATADGEPIRSVFHAAGVAIDAPVTELDADGLAEVFAAKALGAAHLDAALGDVDAFVLFSSVAAAWGSGGQAAYAAANAYLDGLAARRRARGATATSVAWGPWAEVGMATRDGAADRLTRRGVRLLPPGTALAALGSALADDVTGLVVADVDWDRFAPVFTSSRPSPLLAELVEAPEPAAEDTGFAAGLAAMTPPERLRHTLDLVRREAAAVLGHTGTGAVGRDSSFQSLGFDSLLAVEFRTALAARTGLDLPVSLVFDHPTPAALAEHLLTGVTGPAAVATTAAAVSDDPVVIVGMSCRFPGGVDSPEQLWDLVAAGGDAVGGFPTDRGWDLAGLHDPNPDAPGKTTASAGGFVLGAAEFDAPFFGMSPREALATDPQQRLVLETAWEAFERAGIVPAALRGSDTAVFVGAGASGYGSGVTEVPEGAEGYLMTGGAGSVLSGRVAYALGLEGPAVTVDTACSSSLVALHLACRALAQGEASLALAGGVTVMATPGAFIEFSRQRGLADDGRCKSFAAAADGTGWAEGAGMLVLERLSDARRNGHAVLAVVRGSAINSDGASNGLTAPSGPAQQRVIRQALANAGLTAADVDVVEAHGTGTRLGDPIEAQALLATYGQDRAEPLWLGSVKSNLGHTQAAAGVAGIIKVVHAMRHATLPRTLHVDAPTPHVDWSSGAIRLLEQARPWDVDRPRRAAVSAFGVSGTNAHVILEEPVTLEEAEPAPMPPQADHPALVPVSGRTPQALRDNAARLLDLLAEQPTTTPADLAAQLAATRSVFENRAVVRADDRAGLGSGLRALVEGSTSPHVVTGTADADRTVAFVFSGQGAQRAGMGERLHAAHPVFAAAFDEVCAELDRHLDRPLREVVFGGGDLVDQTGYTQAALFAVEVALVRLLESWGVRPDYVGGHSIGELTAAHVAGVLDLADAAELVAARGRLMQALPAGGAMVAVRADEDEVVPLLVDGVSIAAVNGPGAVVVSGAADAVARVVDRVRELGRKTTALRVSHAFHSALMEPMLAEFRAVAARLTYRKPVLPVVSNLTGRLVTGDDLRTADYWVDHVRGTVRFADGVRALAAAGVDCFLEVGPDAVLAAAIGSAVDDRDELLVAATLRRDRDEDAALSATVARLHVGGVPVDLAALTGPARGGVRLPTYAFQRKHYWLAATPAISADQEPTGRELLPGAVTIAGDGGAVLTHHLSTRAHPWLTGHRVSGRVLFPGTGFLDLAFTAADRVGAARIEEFVLAAPLVLDEDAQLQVSVGARDTTGARTAQVHSRRGPEHPWVHHGSAILTDAQATPAFDLAEWPPPGAEPVDTADVYDRFAARGVDYAPPFTGLRAVWRRGEELFAEVELADTAGVDGFGLHPALLDSALHALDFAAGDGTPDRRLPYAWTGVDLHATGATGLRVRLAPTGRETTFAVQAADLTGRPVFAAESLVLRVAPDEVEVPAAPAEAQQAPARPTASAPAAERVVPDEEALLAIVLAEAAAVLGYDSAEEIRPKRTFSDLGFTSLTAVELRNALTTAVGIRLPATLVFDHPTPLALARHLRAELLGEDDTPRVSAPGRASTTDDPIVIVGMGCRYPGGADSPAALWELVDTGTDAITTLPADRGWDLEALYDPDPDTPGTCYAREGGFLHDASLFDPGFFGISPREAVAMDPQQRLLLETSWEALERAGIDPETLRGTQTGVFAGVTYQDYTTVLLSAKDSAEGFLGTGNSPSVLSGRIAYTLGLEGPAVTVDTACSSSLVALHWACHSLRQGDCSLALAGGVTVMATPGSLIEFSRQRALAPDGRSKAFSADADGASWGEGAGMVVLERLSDARRNNHPVLAVVRGSAVNSDGASNGLTAPNGPSQQRVIRRALANAGLSAAEVDLVEAHGTGTTLGDPIEAQALLATYGREHPEDRPLWLGSVKSNIGHPQAAAGVAGVIKVVEAIRHARMPRTLHAGEPSPHVDWTAGAVRLLADARPWDSAGRPRRGAVSSFGMSGTNAHVILEQPTDEPVDQPTAAEPVPLGGPTPFLLSARTAAALRGQAELLAAAVDGAGELSDLAHSLRSTRALFEHRAVLVGADADEVRAGARVLAAGEQADSVVTGMADLAGKTVFVFPGQGAQWAGMATELLATSPVFAESIDACEQALSAYVDWSLRDVLAQGAEPLERLDVVQPVLFAVMVSLARLWQAHGVRPAAVLGHSQGEIAAAHVAGALSLDDAARVVALRSKALLALSGHGGMVSLQVSRADAEDLIGGWGERVSIAAVNGPAGTVVSGDADALDELVAECERTGTRARRVPVDYASHSAHVERIEAELLDVLDGLEPTAPTIPFYSTVDDAWVDSAVFDAGYWYRNLRRTVRFEDGTRALLARGFDVFVEVSPHPVLTMAVQQTAESVDVDGEPAVVGSLRRDEGSPARFLRSVAEAHVRGVPVDFTALTQGRRVELATYPFQRTRFWPTPGTPADTTAVVDAVSAEFWRSVAQADADDLSRRLGVAPDTPLHELVPALADWRRRQEEQHTVEEWGYRVRWQPVRDQRATPAGTWLAVVPAAFDGDPWVASVLASLSEAGVALTPLVVGSPDRAALADELAGHDFDGVLSLLALDESPDTAEPALPAGLVGTLTLVQALDDAGAAAPVWCVTREAVAPREVDRVASVAQALVWGFGRVVALESPARWGGLLDLPAEPDHRAGERVAAALAGSDEDQLSVRSSGTFARRLVRAPGRTLRATAWRPTGTTLITGGTGALGGHLARHLASAGAEHLLLLSRSGPDAAGAEELAADLRALGAAVTIARCDACDRDALARVLAEVPERFPLRAVVHAAGVLDDGVVESLTPDRLAGVVAPKWTAAWNLHELTGDLDAFVLFASTAGVWGGPGQANYAAANAALDALAEHRAGLGLPATSIAWGPWGEEGMAGNAAVAERQRKGGIHALPRALALDVLLAAVSSGVPSLTVAGVDWSVYAPAFTALRPSPLLAGLPEAVAAVEAAAARPGGAPTGLRERVAGLTGADRERAVLEVVREQAAAVLGHPGADAVEPRRAFSDLGFDSLTSVDLRNRLAAATGLRLPSTLVFDHPTATALARHLRGLIGDETAGATEVVETAGAPVAEVDGDPVVIVGMACRFPGGVSSPEELWELVRTGTDAIGPLPTDRGWPLEALAGEGGSDAREGGFLSDASWFDAGFFGISPREALAMDPQQRLVLECAWEALERAGIDPATLRGTDAGVFAGSNGQDYTSLLVASREVGEGHLMTGNAASVLSGRVAYVLGLQGPAVTVDTACSSSLVALHWAVRAIQRGECSLALAGGVTVMATPGSLVEFSRQGGLATDGRCKAFSDDADGTGWSEGVGMLVVERQSDAQRLGHQVLAVVRGSAINSDGASNGLTAPNGPSQERVIRRALADAGLTTSDVDVVEAHGTGTRLGDPIEAQALLATYGQNRSEPLWLGSVKSNIGHTQAAAGVAGVIKVVQAMRHGVLPASLHVSRPTGEVDWESGAVEVLTESRTWAVDRPRRAGVSSFGISGTNAHVILEQAPAEQRPAPRTGTSDAVVPWLVSAREPAAVDLLATHLRGVPGSAADLGWSLATTRGALDERAVYLGADTDELRGAPAVRGRVSGEGRVAVLFSGQGAQRPGMTAALSARFPVFAAALDEVCAHFDLPLAEALRTGDGLDATEVTQPALFAHEVALFRLVESWGVTPEVLLGHSIGGITAAHVAGVWSLADACALVAARGRLMGALPAGGAMVSVQATEAEVAPLLTGRVSIAAVNGPRSVVVSGAAEDVEAVAAELAGQGRKTKRLAVSHAFHSPLMDPVLAEFREVAAGLTYHEPTIPVISDHTGAPVTTELADPDYWVRHLRHAVRFADAVSIALNRGVDTFAEVGPRPVLSSAVHEVVEAAGRTATVAPLAREGVSEDRAVLAGVGALWVAGVEVDWTPVFDGLDARRVDLPTYPFQRERFWPTPATPTGDVTAAGLGSADHPLLGAVVALADGGHVLSGRLSVQAQPWLADHRVLGQVLFPGTGFVELALRAGELSGAEGLDELTITAPLVLPDHGAVQVQVVVDGDDVRVHSRRDDFGDWTLHATGVLARDLPEPVGLDQWPPAGAEPVDVSRFYADYALGGFEYGPVFQGLTAAWRTPTAAYVEVELPSGDAGDFGVHPALLDAVLQGLVFVSGGGARVPFSWDRVALHAVGARHLRARIAATAEDVVSLDAVDATGAPVLSVGAVVMREVSRERLSTADPLLEVAWREFEPTGDPAAEVRTLHVSGGDPLTELSRVLAVVQEHLDGDSAARLVVVTRGGVAVDDGVSVGAQPVDIAGAAVWGLLRSAGNEQPGRVAVIDTDGDVPEALLTCGEPQAAVRGGRCFTPTLTRVVEQPALPEGGWRAVHDDSGSLDGISTTAAEPRPLAPGEVRVSVRATGLNFRDVLTVLGMYPGEPAPLGLEGAGVVSEVGAGVTAFAVGDRVLGMFPAALATTAVADARMLAPIPEGCSFADAATVPIAYLSAYYALHDLAGLTAGERVLVHAAAGGVGMAAVQLARHWGAEVIGTASPAKHDAVRALGLADDAIASSRTTEFADRFAPVDVVLNSLAGEFVDASLRLLAPGGRFVELGKTDVRDPAGVRYRAFDLVEAGPERTGEMLAEVMGLLRDGRVGVLPATTWHPRELPAAFRYMAAARHTGKVVVGIPAPLGAGPVLITGGTGGIGSRLARHLVDRHGVRDLVLLSRTGGADDLVAELAVAGASTRVFACDVTDRAALAEVVARVGDLTAVFHTAGVVDDATTGGLTPERLAAVVRPKLDGARWLHELTLGMDLGAFVVFSGAAGLLGGPGQGNYAAANTALDALARHRHALGLPATALAWGPWTTEFGMTSALGDTDVRRMARGGLRPLSAAEGMAMLDAALVSARTELVPMKVDAAALRDHPDQVPALLRGLVPTARGRTRAVAAAGAPAVPLADRLAEQAPEQRVETLLDLVTSEAAAVLGHASADRVDPERSFNELGFDSLTAVELRNRLGAATGVRLPATLVFDHPTAVELVAQLLLELVGDPADAAPEAGPGVVDVTEAEIEAADPDALFALLDRELEA